MAEISFLFAGSMLKLARFCLSGLTVVLEPGKFSGSNLADELVYEMFFATQVFFFEELGRIFVQETPSMLMHDVLFQNFCFGFREQGGGS